MEATGMRVHLLHHFLYKLKEDLGAWIRQNQAVLLDVQFLVLILPDEAKTISDSIELLRNLRSLRIEGGKCLKYLPHSLINLPHLEKLSVEKCPMFQELPSFFDQLSSLESLTLKDCGITHLSHSFKFLDLPYISIESLPVNLNRDTLSLHRCRIKAFSSSTPKLRALNFHFSLCVQQILVSLKGFHNLESLKLHGNNDIDMESLPAAITELYNLRDLHLTEYWKLKKLPDNMGQLVNLNSLKLEYCGIMCIPTGLCNLKSLTISYCPVDLIIELNTLVSLQILSIQSCLNLKFIRSIGELHQLDDLNLSGCLRLNELPADFDQLTNLSSLYLSGTNIQSLPSTITKLPKLEYLCLPRCFKLETLPLDLNFNSTRVYIPCDRTNALPTKFSIIKENFRHRLHLKATVSEHTDLPDSDGSGRNALGPSRSQLPLRSEDRLAPPAVDNDVERIGENTNQQTSCSVDGETLESEGEGHQPQVIAEGSSSRTEKCQANSKDDNNTPSKKCKRAQKETTSEQTKLPMNQKVPRKNRKINKEDVVQLSGSMTRAAAAHHLKIPEGTFNQYLRLHDIKWPYTRGKKQRQTGLTQRVKQSSDIFVIKAEYAGNTVKFECSSTTSMDEVRNKVREKLKLEQKRFKLNYKDEDNETILMTDDFNLKDAFKASMVKNEKYVRIWVLLDSSD